MIGAPVPGVVNALQVTIPGRSPEVPSVKALGNAREKKKSCSFAHARLLLGFFKQQYFAVIAAGSFDVVRPYLAHARPVVSHGSVCRDNDSFSKIDRLQTRLANERMFERLERSSCWSREGACSVAGIFADEFIKFS